MKTAQLLKEAEDTGVPLARIAREIGLASNTLAGSKHAQRLSPGLAAAIATWLKKPPMDIASWTLVAVAESERSAPLRRKLSEITREMKLHML